MRINVNSNLADWDALKSFCLGDAFCVSLSWRFFSKNSFRSLRWEQGDQEPAHRCLFPVLNGLLSSRVPDFSLLEQVTLVIPSLKLFEKAFLLNDTCFYLLPISGGLKW